MGTNYYAVNHRKNINLHIGKSSPGWFFSFRGYRKKLGHIVDIISFRGWLKFIKKNQCMIVDEYGTVFPLLKFIKLVNEKQQNKINQSTNDWILENQSEEYQKDIFCKDREGFEFIFREFS